MPPSAPNDLWDRACRAASACPDLLSDLRKLYEDLDEELTTTPVACDRCGRCCNFRTFGHQLYMTPAEAALLFQRPSPHVDLARPGRCPYQQGTDCGARHRRTLGCRVFFCRAPETATAQIYEKYNLRIRQLHQRYCIPYAYVALDKLVQSISC